MKRRRFVKATGLSSLGMLLPNCGASTQLTGPTPISSPSRPPSFIVILLDDARLDDIIPMKYIQSLMVAQGLTFANTYVTMPLCGPSRASIYTILKVSSHGIWDNDVDDGKGGYLGFIKAGLERVTISTWLQAVGWTVAGFGKWLNHHDLTDGSHIPLGYNEWYEIFPGNRQFDFSLFFRGPNGSQGWEDYPSILHNGVQTGEFEADVLRVKLLDFIGRQKGPFCAFVNPVSPHLPREWAQRHSNEFLNHPFPDIPSFNLKDKGKPWLSEYRSITPQARQKIIQIYRDRLRSILAADEMVAAAIQKLRETNQLDNTYIFLSSDNGWFRGEFCIDDGKHWPLEPAVHMPLIILGPGVPAGKIVTHVVSLIDIGATLLELAGISIPEAVEGWSLVPFLKNQSVPLSQWRKAVLIEGGSYASIRTPEYVLTDYGGGRELYAMGPDPYQIDNLLYSDPGKGEMIAAELAPLMEKMIKCKGSSCRQ